MSANGKWTRWKFGLTCYAAGIATVSALVSILNSWRDQPIPLFSVDQTFILEPGTPARQDTVIKIANIGHRPLTIVKVWLEAVDHPEASDIIVFDSPEPKGHVIGEGRSRPYRIQPVTDISWTWQICAEEATGEVHKDEVIGPLKPGSPVKGKLPEWTPGMQRMQREFLDTVPGNSG